MSSEQASSLTEGLNGWVQIYHLVSEKLNKWNITNHLSAHTTSYAWLFNRQINVLPWKYSNWRMFIDVKALWKWLYSGWLLPARHLCLLCNTFRSPLWKQLIDAAQGIKWHSLLKLHTVLTASAASQFFSISHSLRMLILQYTI
jgi:hypothetical protein